MQDWQEVGECQLAENELIQKAQDGDAEAFGLLYERHAPAIFRFIYSHLDDRLDAEDLTEDVFLRVWRSLPKFEDQGVPFVAYLFRIARNTLVDYYRRSKNGHKLVSSLEDSVIVDAHPDPGELTIAKMEHQEIRQMLGSLREDYRMVIILRFLSDLSPDETAQAMGKSAGAVRVLQHRALTALRKLLVS